MSAPVGVLTNPNSGTPLSGVSFADALPVGLVVGSPNGLSNTCGGIVQAPAGSGAVALANVTVPASGTCTVRLNAKARSTGVKNNTTTAVTSYEAGLGSPATASVTVTP